jgi:hypothetical protein
MAIMGKLNFLSSGHAQINFVTSALDGGEYLKLHPNHFTPGVRASEPFKQVAVLIMELDRNFLERINPLLLAIFEPGMPEP